METTTEITEKQAQLITDLAADLGADEIGFRLDYSGKAMYGRRVTAITGYANDDRLVFMAIGQLISQDELPWEAKDWFQSRDSLGMGWVIY